ncbi:superoxide dismutase family protein [Gluconobacter cerinus]
MIISKRVLVVHVSADDYRSQPIGGSGLRVICGVIE